MGLVPTCATRTSLDQARRAARCVRKTFVIALLATSWLHARTARGEEYPLVDRPRGGRTVNDHVFIPFRLVESPFVATSFGTSTGAGVATLRTPDERPANVTAFRQSFSLEIAATRWLGFELGGGAFLIAGVNAPGALNIGAALAYGGRVGVVARLFRSRRLYLSARLGGLALSTEGIVPSRLVETEGVRELGDPRVSGRFLRLAGSVQLAVAAFPWLGIQTSVTAFGQRIDSEGRGDGTSGVHASLGVEFDFSPFRIPFAVILAGRFTHTGAPDVQVVSMDPLGRPQGALELGVFYSGRENLVLGLSTLGHYASRDRRLGPEIVFRYFW
jgi:hypothetical protein